MSNPYRATIEQCETPRETEARLLREVSRGLEATAGTNNPGARAAAIDRNRRMWTVFAAQLADDANGLPVQLRADLISIAIAVDRSCSAALEGSAPALQSLIEINRNIAAALG